MTRDEILNMKPGDELDILIAETFFEYKWVDTVCGLGHPLHTLVPKDWNQPSAMGCAADHTRDFYSIQPYKFSSDIGAAWIVVEKLRSVDLSLGWRRRDFSITQMDRLEGGLWVVETNKPGKNNSDRIRASADTASLSICRAALLAVMNV